MTLVKCNPGRTYRRDNSMASFDTIFNDFFNHSFDVESNVATRPMANIKDTKDLITLEIAAPGYEKDDFNISVENKVLTISVDKEFPKSEDKFLRTEFNFQGFSRSFRIGNAIDAEKIVAHYNQGILSIQLEKKEEEKVKPLKQIEVK